MNSQCAKAVQKTPRHNISPTSFAFKRISMKNITGNKINVAIRSCQKLIESGSFVLTEALFKRVRTAKENAERIPHKSPSVCESEIE